MEPSGPRLTSPSKSPTAPISSAVGGALSAVSRPNPSDDWITVDVPELRIVDDALWQAARDHQAELAKVFEATTNGLREARAKSRNGLRRPANSVEQRMRSSCTIEYVPPQQPHLSRPDNSRLGRRPWCSCGPPRDVRRACTLAQVSSSISRSSGTSWRSHSLSGFSSAVADDAGAVIVVKQPRDMPPSWFPPSRIDRNHGQPASLWLPIDSDFRNEGGSRYRNGAWRLSALTDAKLTLIRPDPIYDGQAAVPHRADGTMLRSIRP